VVVLSPEARAMASGDGSSPPSSSTTAPSTPGAMPTPGSTWATQAPDGKPLTPAQSKEVVQLRARDAEVRAHEAAHLAASGGLGGSPTFSYEEGPDGKRYAVGGEVAVDTSPGRTPEETIARARTIRAAATAPADPSAQDIAVAASATHMEAQAQSELQAERHIAWQSTAQPASDRSDAVAREGAAPATDPAAPAADPEITLMTLSREKASNGDGINQNPQTSYARYQRAASAYVSAGALGATSHRR